MTEALRLHDLLPDYYEGNVEMDALTSAEQPLIDKLFSSISLALDNQFVPTADSNTLSLYEKMEGNVEMDALTSAEQPLIDKLFSSISLALDNQFVPTADSNTLSLYEKMLKLPIYEDDTLEQRRFRILSKIGNKKPYTQRSLEEVLSAFGPLATLEMDYANYLLRIESNFEKYGQIEEIESQVRQIAPANLILDFDNRLEGFMRSGVFLASAMAVTEVVQITHDFVESTGVYNVAHVAGAPVTTSVTQITHDFIETSQVSSAPVLAVGKVIAEIIEF